MKGHAIGSRSETLGRGLGIFSIGLGVSEIFAPRQLSRLIGVNEHPTLMRMLGIREALSGIGILTQDRPAASLWSRVAGDGMDLALLGAAMPSRSVEKKRFIAAVAAVAGVTVLDAFASIRFTKSGRLRQAKSVMTINRPQSEVYAFWREPKNLNGFMKSIPAEYEIISARPDSFIEWRSSDGVVVKSGSASFSPAFGRDGTEVRVFVDGLIPTRLLHEDLRRSKRLIETGEIATTEGQSAGPRFGAVLARMIHRFEGKEVA